MIFTLDLDFADLRKFSAGSHPGVVLFRPRSMGPLAVNQFVLKFTEQTELAELARCLAIVEPHRVRVRRPSIFDEPIEWEEISLDKDKPVVGSDRANCLIYQCEIGIKGVVQELRSRFLTVKRAF